MVSIQNLHFSYGKRPVFQGLDLELRAGHIYGILGRNGMGKSTLLRSIGGFLLPRKGAIKVLGYAPGQRQPVCLQEVVLVPEDFVLPSMKLTRWVDLYGAFYDRFDRSLFDRTSREFDISSDARLDEMSYGQQKKVLISFAIATNASVLLMDEPTNGLDIVSKSQFRKIIAASIGEDRCMVISTHQVKDLENLIDRVTFIDEGRIVFDESIDDISQKLLFRHAYDPADLHNALYRENAFGGDIVLLPNTDGRDSRPDLEILYKAVMLNGEKLKALFKTKG